ncbi:hypothetical protein JQC91_01260 [Jannaschia sp. Os4]|uniref:hypothetical protein n=1 Tax=Jannaschia sp. Os4 TaxID=2807617 RepID=UPI0019397959|nr:hypothetical protein [Jannaschia sp. Os4]MBM2574920.1 hypothetical protein [Jannaschia sp. Os4]
MTHADTGAAPPRTPRDPVAASPTPDIAASRSAGAVVSPAEPAPVEGRINGHDSYPQARRRTPLLLVALAAVIGALLLFWLLGAAGDDVARVGATAPAAVVATD